MPRVNQNTAASIRIVPSESVQNDRVILGTVEGLSKALVNKVLVLRSREQTKLINAFDSMLNSQDVFGKTIDGLLTQLKTSLKLQDDECESAIADGKRILQAIDELNGLFSDHKSPSSKLQKVVVHPIIKFNLLKSEAFLLNQKIIQFYNKNDERFDLVHREIKRAATKGILNQVDGFVHGESSHSVIQHDLKGLYIKINECLDYCSTYNDFYLELNKHYHDLKAVVLEIIGDSELYESVYQELQNSGYRDDIPYVDGTKPNEFVNRLSKVVLLSTNMTHQVISIFGDGQPQISNLLSCVSQKEMLALCRDIETLIFYMNEQEGIFNQEIANNFIVPMLRTCAEKINHDSLSFMQAYVERDLRQFSSNEQKIISSFFNSFSKISGFIDQLLDCVQNSVTCEKRDSQGFKSSFVYAELPEEYKHADFVETLGVRETKALIFKNALKDIGKNSFLDLTDSNILELDSELLSVSQIELDNQTKQQLSTGSESSVIQSHDVPGTASRVVKMAQGRIQLMVKVREDAECLLKKINRAKAMFFQESPINVKLNLKFFFDQIDKIKGKANFLANSSFKDDEIAELKSNGLINQFSANLIELNKTVSKLDDFKNKMINPHLFIDLCKLYQNPNSQLVSELFDLNEVESVQYMQCICTSKDKILEYKIQFKPLNIFHGRNLLPLWLHVHVPSSVPANAKSHKPEFSRVIVAHLKNNAQRGYGANWDEIQKRQSLFHNLVKRSQVYNELYNKIIQFPQLM